MRLYEANKRSLTKTITYRVVVIVSDIVVIYWLTHRVDITVSAVIGTNVITTLLYYGHERLWNNIRWGIIHKK